jgi:small subunit ribosomal protein S21
MLKVKVKDGKIDKALKQLKRKVRKTKQQKEIRKGTEHTKKSVKRRDEVQKATYKQSKKNEEEY